VSSEDELWKLTAAGIAKGKSIYSNNPIVAYLYETGGNDKGGGTATTGEIATNTGNSIVVVSASLRKFQRQRLVERIG